MKSVIAKEKSENIKTGHVSVTYVSQASCPNTCPFRDNGCYAETGPLGIHTKRLNKSEVTDPLEIAKEEAAGIDTLSGKLPLRLHGVGDCKTVEAVETVAAAAARFTAKHGQPVWTYTHEHNTPRKAWGSISVLQSCETVEQAAKSISNGFAAALVVGEYPSTKAYDLGHGLKGIPCPAATKRAKNCKECKLCFNADKLGNRVIVFAAHGVGAKRVKNTVSSSS